LLVAQTGRDSFKIKRHYDFLVKVLMTIAKLKDRIAIDVPESPGVGGVGGVGRMIALIGAAAIG
jgi:hypothetical protein